MSSREAFSGSSAESDEPTAWFADEVARRGAYAAFLGVRFKETRGITVQYEALSVGDVCLLHVDAEGRATSFPVTTKEEFTSQPELISSAETTRPLAPATTSGGLTDSEYLLMATDGVAALLLGEPELLPDLLRGTTESVQSILLAARAEARAPDDDYTLIRITLAKR